MRGKDEVRIWSQTAAGITPAYAGKSVQALPNGTYS